MRSRGLDGSVRHLELPDTDVRASKRELEARVRLAEALGLLSLTALGDVTEYEDDSGDDACIVEDRRAGVVDRHLSAVPGQEHCVIGQPDDGPEPEHLGRGILDGQAGLFVHDAEDARQRLPDSIRLRPTGQRLCDRVHEPDVSLTVCRDDGITDAGQRHRIAALTLAKLLLGDVLVEGHLDRGAELGVHERLDEVTERLGLSRPEHRRIVRVRGQKDHRHPGVRAELCGRVDPVNLSFELNVHEHEIRLRRQRQRHRIFAARSRANDGVPDPCELLCNVACDDAFVFDDEDPRRRHRRLVEVASSKVIENVAPGARLTVIVPAADA